ncbi:uncharacterized protein LOC130719035 [Lotus japonicus]|uniref:uncharacterized protein LOC130719035 n=1 Tax=Lotus japonicus TaxID=34305 RepID=UPI00258FE4B3|nr:uncharacterized protein LOC130719035 [Lotus japonicus]
MELGVWVTWNVRGLCGSGKRRVVKHAVSKLKPTVLLFQETKLDAQRQHNLEDMAKTLHMGLVTVPASGTSGGLATLWRLGSLEVVGLRCESRYILLFVKYPGIAEILLVGNIYGAHTGENRRLMYAELLEAMRGHIGGMILGGDYNTILKDGERKNEAGLGVGDREFKEFVGEAGLLDFPLHNSQFTWFSSRNNGIWSRLDRWFVSEDLMMLCTNVTQTVLDWSCSDHRAVSISFGSKDFGPKPFYYFNHWVLEDGFQELVRDWWDSAIVEGWSGFVLQSKLKGLRVKIREWRKKKGSWGVEKIKILEESLNDIMQRMENEGVSENLRRDRLVILEDLWKEYRVEERTWLAKSRLRWMKEGDRKSRYFHKVCKVKMAKKNLSQLEFGGRVLEDPNEIKEAIKQHFQTFFQQEACARPVLRSPGVSGIGGVLHNSNGNILAYFSMSTGILWAYEAEVLIESDSTLAIGWTLNSHRRPWKLQQIFNQIDYLWELVSCVGIQHILREGNGVADFWAKQGCGRSDVIWSFTETNF